MSDFFRGKNTVRVLRPNHARDMFGDRIGDGEEFTIHEEHDCFISYTTAWAPPAEIKKFPISAVDRDVTLYFDRLPDIAMEDFVELGYNEYRYRVIVVDPYYSSIEPGRVATAVRISALETERK